MPAVLVLLAALLGVATSADAGAQPAAQLYRDKCGSCHDSGAGQAPRITDRAAWTARIARGRRALHDAAIRGLPDTAMAPRGGFAELSDAEVRAIVDYMLAAIGQADLRDGPVATAMPASAATPAAAQAPAGANLAATVAARLRAAFGGADARVEEYAGVYTVRGVGIKVELRDGGIILAGAVHDAGLIERAAGVAAATPGVARVVNRLIAAAQLEWD